MSATALRIDRGRPDPEELAALTAVLCARAAARTAQPPAPAADGDDPAWLRPDGYLSPRGWSDRPAG
ncbi:acyl-CoA carboxylase subunit epsilon [Streptomyces sp. TLI_171]|uniref:acyl-CoA carboxylase subunit epsilon n=1 Tax=Streptomyces sp. TLI_171 TaxID=1938859 RepID=UPI000C1827B0|nr:acyl-CoA carboxylase subunit epsilon [Streptomyces sp. TLI_171]RKE20797.1 acyl-CoA carboxylase epsilon subunit-like protein [Streptomyces sp. TLI_171]